MKLFPFFWETKNCADLLASVKTQRKEVLVDDMQDADMILVWGWDGWMLHAMRQYHDQGLPFFGLHCGTLWFLTNKDCLSCIEQLASQEIELITIHSLDVTLTDTGWKHIEWFARNDLVVWGNVFDYSHFAIWAGTQMQVSGTWLVISTALWSTAYAANLGTPIIPLHSTLWSISGIATGEYKYSFVSPDDQYIDIDIQSRSPISVALDGFNAIHPNIKKIQLRPGTHTARLAFLASEHFAERRLLLAEKKLGR